jgi:hypothetical protein
MKTSDISTFSDTLLSFITQSSGAIALHESMPWLLRVFGASTAAVAAFAAGYHCYLLTQFPGDNRCILLYIYIKELTDVL